MFFFLTRKEISLDGVRINDLPLTGQMPHPLELREHQDFFVDKHVIYLCNNTCPPDGSPKCESRLWCPS